MRAISSGCWRGYYSSRGAHPSMSPACVQGCALSLQLCDNWKSFSDFNNWENIFIDLIYKQYSLPLYTLM